jgi:hypothetical protein
MSYIFVGEKPSKRALDIGASWEKGGLAAKTLHDALEYNRIDPKECGFVNLFGDNSDDKEQPILGVCRALCAANRAGVKIVGMGRKVQRHLKFRGVPHIPLVHPAARGKIRDKHRYIDHVKEMLKHD